MELHGCTSTLSILHGVIPRWDALSERAGKGAEHMLEPHLPWGGAKRTAKQAFGGQAVVQTCEKGQQNFWTNGNAGLNLSRELKAKFDDVTLQKAQFSGQQISE